MKARRPQRAQRGFIATLLLTPFLVALLAWPLVAQLTVLKARQKAADEQVRLMLLPKGAPRVPRTGIAAEAAIEAEAEVLSTFRF